MVCFLQAVSRFASDNVAAVGRHNLQSYACLVLSKHYPVLAHYFLEHLHITVFDTAIEDAKGKNTHMFDSLAFGIILPAESKIRLLRTFNKAYELEPRLRL